MNEQIHSGERGVHADGGSESLPLLAPPDVFDPVVEACKKDVDRTLIRENLRRTPHERAVRMQAFILFLEKWRGAAWATDPSSTSGSGNSSA
jgi:hypothetical protein